MNERLFLRELGCRRPTAGRSCQRLHGSGPLAFERSFTCNEDLIKRLTQTAEFAGDAACVSNLTWSPDGEFLAAGGEDCRITVWEPGVKHLKHTIDMGHTSTINSVRYLPSKNNEYIVSASNDKEVRLVNLVKKAVMPYKNHRGKVKSIAVIDPAMFLSAGEDGTVRQVDLRSSSRTMTLIADQRQEKTGVVKTRVPINSIALCPLHPHLFATGGGDAIVRLYDRRMCNGQGSKPHKTAWFAGYMPMHFKSTLIHRLRPVPPLRPNVHISGVAFSHDGRKLFASYTNEQIYSFSCKQHQRAAAYFEAPDPSAHATRSTARLHRPTARRWPTAALSQDTAEAAQGPAQQEQQQQQHAGAQQQGGGTRTTGVAAGPGGPLAAAQRVDQGALAAQNAPGTVTLATAITMATQQFIQRVQAVQPTDEAMREMVREMAEEINAQAPPMGPAAGPRQADVPDQAGLRRTASAPVPDVPGGADVATTISDAIFLGMNAAIQQDQAEDVANPAAHPGEGNAGGSQARSAARPEQSPGAAAASNAEGNAISPTESQEARQWPRRTRQTSRRGGSSRGLVSRSGSVQAPLAQSVGRVAPAHARESLSAQEALNGTPQDPNQVIQSPVTRQATRRAGQPHQATRPVDAPEAPAEAVEEAVVQSTVRTTTDGYLSAVRDMRRLGRNRARQEEAEAELAGEGPPARRQRRAPEEQASDQAQNRPTSPRQAAQGHADSQGAVHATSTPAAEAQPADAPRPVRQAASTLAAAGNAFAVAGRSTERPTASTGTSRPVTRQQAALKKEEGSPGAPEQASGHTGQPSGFRAPLPRSCAPHQAAAANRHNGEDGFPAGQASAQLQPAEQRRVRPRRGHSSDRHSGAGSTTRQAQAYPGEQGHLPPVAARQGTAANGEGSSGQPAVGGSPNAHRFRGLLAARVAQAEATELDGPAPARQGMQHVTSRAASAATQHGQEAAQRHEAAAASQAHMNEGGKDRGPGRTGTAQRGRSRAAPAAEGGSEPKEEPEDVCCERARSAHAQDKSAKGAGSPPSVQHAPAEQHSTQQRALQPAVEAVARDSPSQLPAQTHARSREEATAAPSVTRQASPQLAVIQDGTSQGPRRRRAGTGQQNRTAAAAADVSGAPARTDAPEAVSEVGMGGRPARVPDGAGARSGLPVDGRAEEVSPEQRGVGTPFLARSSPNSSAAAIDTGRQGDDGADVVGPYAHQRRARRSAAGETSARGVQDRQQQQGADSYIGAIMDVSDADDGEVVEEDGMFDMVYTGHCNKQGCKEVSLIGEQSDFVCSGSDGGSIFIWNAKTGQLVNVIRANETVTTCVAPHPHVPILASCGFEPAVRLWSPEAEEATKLEHAEEVMRQNALDLAQRTEAVMVAPQVFLNMGLVAPNPAVPMPAAQAAPELRLNRGDDNRDNAVRCSIM